jgi:ABC-type multidrug transport system ATPase subunit
MTVQLLFLPWSTPRPPRNYSYPELEAVDPSATCFFLLANETWDDYGFQTMFLIHLLVDGEWMYLGTSGIARFGQEQGSSYDELGRPFELDRLSPDFYSLGREADYYENLGNALSTAACLQFLRALNDVAIDTDLHDRASGERAYEVSLTRSNSAIEALDKARSLIGLSSARLRDQFRAIVHLEGASAAHAFDFDFSQTSAASSRMNVLVGLNGSGKTQSMASLARLISRVMTSDGEVDTGASTDRLEPRPSIYSVVAISFSAFDDFVVPDESVSRRFRYTYCGLRHLQEDAVRDVDRRSVVLAEVRERFEAIDEDQRFRALMPLVPSLDADFDFHEASESGVLPYDALSAGQRIVLAASCELVRHVGDRTLVMMDEPEIHLHPQLLSSLVAWTVDLLEETDSFAVVATHSPSVVQQVRASSVHVLKRSGTVPHIVRPAIETFGANLTEIAHEVFEDREGDRSYQDVLERLYHEHGSVEAVNALFDHRLRMNALIYLRSLEAE